MKIQNTSEAQSEDNKQKEREWRKGRESKKGKEGNRTWSRPESRNVVWHFGNEVGVRESKRQKKQNERVETRGKKSLTGKVAECLKNKHYQVYTKVDLKNKMESTILMM